MPRQMFVAILDTMWGEGGNAPHWFLINPRNASGRRLYKLTQSRVGALAVVNACPEQASHANGHGKPDTLWLAHSLAALPARYTARGVPLLVCGRVAQQTFQRLNVKWDGPVICMPHPAARNWSREQMANFQKQIARSL